MMSQPSDLRDRLAAWMAETGSSADVETGLWTLLGETSTEELQRTNPLALCARLKDWERYQKLRLLGFGGGGMVFEAFDPRLERNVALKFIWAGEKGAEHALQEARAQAKVDHPNVVKVFEVDHILGLPYFAMQLVEGPPLSTLRGRLDSREVAALLQQVAQGLDAAHRSGLVHLDIKPGNILVDSTQPDRLHALVSDFGLVCGASPTGRSSSGGTPPYASPEQMGALEAESGPLSDVYGLGACLHFLLGGTFPELDPSLRWQPLPPLNRVTDPELAAVVRRATALEPSQRYPSVEAVAQDLERYLNGQPVHARSGHRWRGILGSRWVRYAGLAALFLFAILTVIGGYRSRVQNRQVLAFDQQFTQVSRELENRVRFARTSPMHDLRPEFEDVRKRLKELEAQLPTTPKEGQGAIHTALGRGWLALNEAPRALEYLCWAWEHGYRNPGCASALGQAYAQVYREEVGKFGFTVGPGLAKQKSQGFQKFGKPAIELLSSVKVGPGENAKYIAAVVELCKNVGGLKDCAEGLRLAQEAQQEAPWFYEAAMVESSALMAQVMGTQGGGSDQEIEALYIRIEAVLERARRIGRSDERIALMQVGLQIERLTRKSERGDVGPNDAKAADALIREARSILPSPDVDMVELQFQVCAVQQLHPPDWEQRYTRGLELGRALVNHPMFYIQARRLLSVLLFSKASRMLADGQDPVNCLDEGELLLKSLVDGVGWTQGDLFQFEVVRICQEQIKGLDPATRMQADLGVAEKAAQDYAGDYGAPLWEAKAWSYCVRAALDRGQLSEAPFAQLRRCAAEALRLASDAPFPQRMRGMLALLEAQAALQQGRDPELFLADATLWLEKARKAQPDDPSNSVNFGKAQLMRASAGLLRGKQVSRELAKAHAYLSGPFPKGSLQVAEADLLPRVLMLQAAQALQSGLDAVPILEQAERLSAERIARAPVAHCLVSFRTRIAACLAWIDPQPHRLATARAYLGRVKDPTLSDYQRAHTMMREAAQGHRPTKEQILVGLATW